MHRFLSAMVAAMLSTVAVGADAEPIKLGSKAFIQNILVAEITKQYLEAKGFEAGLRSGLGSTVIHEAIVSRQIDLYWEYTGPDLVNYNETPVCRGMRWLRS